VVGAEGLQPFGPSSFPASPVSVLAYSPVFFQLRPDGVAVLDVFVHFHFRASVHVQQSYAVLKQGGVQAAQVGEWEREFVAVIETQQKTPDNAALPRVALGNRHQSLQGGNASSADSWTLPLFGCDLGRYCVKGAAFRRSISTEQTPNQRCARPDSKHCGVDPL
jgi:hypothetical protein